MDNPIPISLGLIAGLLAGSFIATLAIRWPTEESALRGRSRCDDCKAAIGVWSLIPLIGFLRQRGRAACCGARIDPLHPAAEAVAAAIGGISASQPPPYAIAGAVLGWMLLSLALVDLRTFRLPNAIVGLLAFGGIAASLSLGSPAPLDALIGLLAGYVSLKAVQLAYRAVRGREGLGSGDPKLFAAIGACVGWQGLPSILLAAALLGLAWAAALRLTGRSVGLSARLPLGALLAAAAWPAWLWQVASPSL